MEKQKQIRINADAQIRSEDDDFLIGYASVFNEQTDLGMFRESIAPGAFSDALARKDDTRVLFNHNPDLLLARSTNETLVMEEDEIGLRCKIHLPDTTLGNDLRVLIRQGTISQMSFGFYIEREEKRGAVEGKPWYEIQSVRLFDVAPVTYPAYEGTSIKVSRSLEERTAQIQAREVKESQLFEYRQRKLQVSKKRGYRV